MTTWRSEETEHKYTEFRAQGGLDAGCRLCALEPLQSFQFWKLCKNDFPYDAVAQVHHMLIPKRHVTDDGLSEEELHELKTLKKGVVNDNYDYIVDSTNRTKSIPTHVHLHLLSIKK